MSAAAPEPAAALPRGGHIGGLDTLRFIAALWVVLGHWDGLPFLPLLRDRGWLGHLVAGINGVLFNGVAAVTLFFLISGFCIHYPWARAGRVDVRRHLMRRYVRIGGPLLASLAIAALANDAVRNALFGVLWSVYCELIYYTLYPALFLLFRRYGVTRALAAATMLSTVLIASRWSYLWPWQFGVALTWAVGLPSWLLGCLLAERLVQRRLVPGRSIWPWRAAALMLSAGATGSVFHAPIAFGYPASMLVFAFFCFFWLKRELARYAVRPPLRLLEWAGGWSYSLYLIHNMVIAGFAAVRLAWPYAMGWTAEFLAILLASYAFYAGVERPSHALARRLGKPYTLGPRAAVEAHQATNSNA